MPALCKRIFLILRLFVRCYSIFEDITMNIDITKANPLAFAGYSEAEIKAELERRQLVMAEYEKYRESTGGLTYADSSLIYNVSQKVWDKFAKDFAEFKLREVERARGRKIAGWTCAGVLASATIGAIVLIAKSR